MAANVIRVEGDIPDLELNQVWVNGAVCRCEAIMLQHEEQRGLPRVVKAKEDDVSFFVEKTCPTEERFECVVHEH